LHIERIDSTSAESRWWIYNRLPNSNFSFSIILPVHSLNVC
jgi:hypothetical protein